MISKTRPVAFEWHVVEIRRAVKSDGLTLPGERAVVVLQCLDVVTHLHRRMEHIPAPSKHMLGEMAVGDEAPLLQLHDHCARALG